MRIESSKELLAYWNALRGEKDCPERKDINPGELAVILGDVFLAETTADGECLVRLAGTKVCSLYGREFRAAELSGLWSLSQDEAGAFIWAVTAEHRPIVIHSRGFNLRGEFAELETMMLPIRAESGLGGILGVHAPIYEPYWLRHQPFTRCKIIGHRYFRPVV